MKNKLLLIWVFAFSALPLFAQIEVKRSMQHDSFLLYESIPVRVEIRNVSGGTLQFGGEEPNAYLRFVVRNTRNQVIHRTDVPLYDTMWVIPDGIRSARNFDLVQLYQIRNAESYRCEITLIADGEQWKLDPLLFAVKNGTSHGTVRRRSTDRSFSLISVNRKSGDELMLRLSDYREQTTLATYTLERVMLFIPPEMRVDHNGRVHILFYQSNRQMVYCRFHGDGRPIIRQYLRPTTQRPRLVEHEEFGFWVPGAEVLEPLDPVPAGDAAPPAAAGATAEPVAGVISDALELQ
ncbi:MAG: hypothetical protein JJU29_15140 [Verrucomicrobia bacterium]|nr:hypothetical protein [Verrucomicrobiota bacterium]MCH8512438.1 hypothetical protein [Kiritimatiellia bacterium]